MTKIRGLAEAQRMGDVVDGHSRVAQVLDRDFDPQLIEDVAKGGLLLPKSSPERTYGGGEMLGDILQARLWRGAGAERVQTCATRGR